MIEEIILKSKVWKDYSDKDEEKLILTNPQFKLRNNGKKKKYLILKKSEENQSIKFEISESDYYHFLKNQINIIELNIKKKNLYRLYFSINLEIKEEL